ncbi:phosphomannomutase [Microbacteriaceae bacterium SG_E_30_P1]|uniref:Phosphomannomutase n=1 Tax=Antiquaquibacter oligotrophicus TaxID=2880260 RepID=A0ABT6KPM4_9MICO|nr:phospho-sugar mutase [Antiquaquibacter oligotrophicus]MDH6181751.1 phosphomannomutase [Antiquaquibacter oligotrophicus]UDF12568.1 phospho-sugar mutase [Antiquaquibacter oligotrophicus]
MSSEQSTEVLLAAARDWAAQDPDATTRTELESQVTAAEAGDPAAEATLRDWFGSRLHFGTAGLRGELGPGPNRMNRVLVTQAAAGLAAFLLSREPSPSVVIGFDARTNSEVFARDTAVVMAGAGVRTTLMPRNLPTPVLAFAVRHLGVSAGVMVTASHNPARDNGYKVYLGGLDHGSQIVSPSDTEIAHAIERVAHAPISELPRSTDFVTADESVITAYVEQTAAIANVPAPVRFAYTAMHGVGWETARAVFAAAGLGEPDVVAEQAEPDPTFPTVAFPNPEEPGAMDLVLALGESVGADLVVANDPDADRLAIGIPTASGWRRLSGNEVGWLLGWRAAKRASVDGVLAASIVSSPALGEVASAHRLRHVETLTGFKWISRVPGLTFGYEEALGYLVDPAKVLDKDGISAAVDLLSLASELKAGGSTLERHLLDFAETFGGFASGQISIRVTELDEIGRMMTALRTQPPGHIGSLPVAQIDDFLDGFAEFPPGDILRFHLANGARVIVRPSGTEPKLKVYLDASSTEGDGASRIAAARAVVSELDAGIRALLGV